MNACSVTHGQLLSGRCPWCSDYFRGSEAEIRWNLEKLIQGISNNSSHVREITTKNLLLHGPRFMEALPIYLHGLSSQCETTRKSILIGISIKVRTISTDDLDELEEHIRRQPSDVALRIVMIICSAKRRSPPDSSRRKLFIRHILWMIENYPGHEILCLSHCHIYRLLTEEEYRACREMWLQNIARNPDNLATLWNAAHFYFSAEPGTAEGLLKSGHIKDPSNVKWSERLALLYSLFGTREYAAKCLETLETVLAGSTSSTHRITILAELARSYLDVGDLERAKVSAMHAINGSANIRSEFTADVIHLSHIVLGRVAVREGDKNGAGQHLIEAVNLSGSPVLNSFGPNMTLAKELLELGEKDVVITFLTLSSRFWHNDKHQAEQWIGQIDKGAIPDFGINLSGKLSTKREEG